MALQKICSHMFSSFVPATTSTSSFFFSLAARSIMFSMATLTTSWMKGAKSLRRGAVRSMHCSSYREVWFCLLCFHLVFTGNYYIPSAGSQTPGCWGSQWLACKGDSGGEGRQLSLLGRGCPWWLKRENVFWFNCTLQFQIKYPQSLWQSSPGCPPPPSWQSGPGWTRRQRPAGWPPPRRGAPGPCGPPPRTWTRAR